MRKWKKEQLLDILNSLLELHKELVGRSISNLEAELQDCQQAAIIVGQTLEQDAPEETEAVSVLEKYCEALYLLSQQYSAEAAAVQALDELITQAVSRVEAVSVIYQAVFFPYKAEMWDSLESIWRACKEDERCQAVVVPIPYYQYDAATKQTVPVYDGDRFPEDVEVVDYTDYSLQEQQPEIAYIHNPYDNCNLVTSVHPAFYSSELKKYVKKLVYVPYYVTTGAISQEHLMLPAYLHMDYMVVQSEYFKSGCREMPYYDRVLPLGSPKLDRVIRLCAEKQELPADWERALQGKKSLMLNTSLNCFLQQGEIYLQKLFHLFEWVKKHEGIVLVWRPHPLLEATVNSMRPQLLEKYRMLVAYFISEEIGILDKTPDIARTVAAVDGYIGEEATSVVNLFGAAGKPLFILNNFIYQKPEEEWQRRIRITDMVSEGGKWYLTTPVCNGLFSMDGSKEDSWDKLELEGCVNGQSKWYGSHPFLTASNGRIYLSPGMAFGAAVYDCNERKFSGVPSLSEDSEFMRCGKAVSYKGKVFYLPEKNGSILECREKMNSVTGCEETKKLSQIIYTECMDAFRKGLAPELYRDCSDILDYVQVGSKLYLVAQYCNRILCFDMESADYRVYEVGDPGFGYSAIEWDGAAFWLAENKSGRLLKVRVEKASATVIQEISIPDGFGSYAQSWENKPAHRALYKMGEWIITVPAYGNGMVKVHKDTYEVVPCAQELWEDADKTQNDYHPQVHGVCCFSKKIDENTLWLQRTKDDALIEWKADSEKFTVHYPEMTEAALERLLKAQDGFERPNRDFYAFARRESRLFSLENFMEDLLRDNLQEVRERQLTELSSFAANLDGSCGKKVHEYLVSVLEQTS